jgi:hypothetical protein
MKRHIFSLLLILSLLALPGTGAQPAAAVVNNATSNCSSVTVTGSAGPSTAVYVEVREDVPPTYTILGSQLLNADGAGNYSSVVGIPTQPAGTVLRINVTDSTGFYQLFPSCTPGAAAPGAAVSEGAVLSFDPGDGRVDPRPGDRLAIWCNLGGDTPYLLVYGVAPDSKGFFLARINFADILKGTNGRLSQLNARLKQLVQSGKADKDPAVAAEIEELTRQIGYQSGVTVLSRNLGHNGVLSVSGDAQNTFWVNLVGGPYGASGQGDWAKSFKCDFKR